MALRCMKLLKTIRSASLLRHNVLSTVSDPDIVRETGNKPREYKTEQNLIYNEDPDTFGTLTRGLNRDKVLLEDEGDIREEKHVKNNPLPFQKLTTKQYADIIKQYLKLKRFKEALNVLEVRMLKEDRVKPENYIYNILIGACADVGYTKKAFKLYNDMKKRALTATGDTYTCLFHACANSPFPSNGLKSATNLRELMIEKGIEPNLTNYNSMIKAFGRCGDLATSFKIVDEMVSKGVPIRVHTYNHLLHACISDKERGLEHALLVWRKMLRMREKPNIYSFNLMLKCVKECNMGSKADIEGLISALQDQIALQSKKKPLQIEQAKLALTEAIQKNEWPQYTEIGQLKNDTKLSDTQNHNVHTNSSNNELDIVNNNLTVQVVKLNKPKEERTLPNLLSKELQLDQVMSFQEIATVQDKFAIIGGQEDFIREMKAYAVKPDIKTFTQMLPLLEETVEAENKLLETMKAVDLKADIDFYNMLIKKRCLRSDYDAAFEVKELIEKESKYRKRKHPLKKKLALKINIMTYGVLAMACKTQENAEKLLSGMKTEQIKVNIEILGTLLRQGTTSCDFGYVLKIMNEVKNENIQVNHIFLKHLENFKEKCSKIVKSKGKAQSDTFSQAYRIFSMGYTAWLKDIDIEKALKPEHPWAQFKETYPETVQRQNIEIKMPRNFYRKSRKA